MDKGAMRIEARKAKGAWLLPVLSCVALLAAGQPARGATVTLEWDAVTTNADGSPIADLAGYRVFYATYSLLSMTTAQAMASGSVVKAVPSVPSATTTTYAAGSLVDGTSYYFRVAAFDASGNQSGFNWDGVGDVEVSTFTPPPLPPTVPGTPMLTALSFSQVKLTWTDSAGETSYRVERSADGGVSYSTATTLGANVVTYTDSGLTGSTTYFYRVAAKNAVGETFSVAASTVTPAAPVTPPVQPTGLSTAAASSTEIDLSWSDNSTDETGFEIVWSLSAGFTSVSTITVTVHAGTGAMTYSHTGLTAATTYYYKIRAVNGVGKPALWPGTPVKAVTPPPPLTPPATPGAAGLVVLSSTTMTVSWGNVANETGYLVERSLSSGTGYGQVGSVGVNMTSFTDVGLSPNTYYYYRVRAYNGAGNSGYTAEVYAKTGASVTASGFSVPPGLRECYAYPNPAHGVDPVIRAMMGGVDLVEITIYDQAGQAVKSDRVTESVNVNGEPAYEYTWTGTKASGIYYAVIHGKKGSQTIRARTSFAVVR